MKNTNSERKRRMSNQDLQAIKQNLVHLQKKNLHLKNILTEINKSENKVMRDKQKEIPRNTILIISHFLKMIRNTN